MLTAERYILLLKIKHYNNTFLELRDGVKSSQLTEREHEATQFKCFPQGHPASEW